MNATVASIRFEANGDTDAVRRVHADAFGHPAEAELVDALRRQRAVAISLVAEHEHELVGNVVLSEVTLMPSLPGLRMLGLGPVAVRSGFQRHGIGAMLISQAIDQARAEGWHALVTLGDHKYYSRFGFIPASRLGLGCEFQVPDEAFMILELRPGTLQGLRGVVRYQPEFSNTAASLH